MNPEALLEELQKNSISMVDQQCDKSLKRFGEEYGHAVLSQLQRLILLANELFPPSDHGFPA